MRKLLVFAITATASAQAQYVAQILPTPGGSGRAEAAGGGQIVGVAFGAGGGPALWDGPNHTYSVLNTAGYSSVEVAGVGGGEQVGHGFSGTTRALMWSGPGTNPVSLHNSMFVATLANATDGISQVGEAGVGGFVSHAVLWNGTPESAVDLHPAGYENSNAFGVWEDIQVGGVAGSSGGGRTMARYGGEHGTTASACWPRGAVVQLRYKGIRSLAMQLIC